MNNTNPFFIISAPRSGSSLLSAILNAHENIAVPPETHIFNIFCPILKYYGDLSLFENKKRLVSDIISTYHISRWSPGMELDDIMNAIQCDSFKGIFDALLSVWTQKQGKKRWGEKTPQHLYFWKEIISLYPDAKFIHLVRDGRDVSLSLSRAHFGPATLFTASQRWQNEMKTIQRFYENCSPGNVLTVKYEQLLLNPAEIIHSVCQFLGESYSDNLLEFYKRDEVRSFEQKNSANLAKPILTGNRYKWRQSLSRNEIKLIESVAFESLKKYDYNTHFDKKPKLNRMRRSLHQYGGKYIYFLPSLLKKKESLIYELIVYLITMKIVLRYHFTRLSRKAGKNLRCFFLACI